jgi:hypothetical protein
VSNLVCQRCVGRSLSIHQNAEVLPPFCPVMRKLSWDLDLRSNARTVVRFTEDETCKCRSIAHRANEGCEKVCLGDSSPDLHPQVRLSSH